MRRAALFLSLAVLALPAPAYAAFPGKNGRIAFVSTIDSPDPTCLSSGPCVYEIYTMNADGSDATRLTNDGAYKVAPTWSPDANRIVFGKASGAGIYTMNADGTNQTRLVDSAAGDVRSVWSPDGKKIAFTSYRDGNNEIYVMNADGTNQTRLTNNPQFDGDVTWSPDGSKIAFTTRRLYSFDVYTMNADGTNQTRLTNNTGPVDRDPSWSPDGTKIAFDTDRDGLSENFEIYTMNADGTNQTRVTNSIGVDRDPSWSPDGKKLAFAHSGPNVEVDSEIVVIDVDGTNETQVTDNTARDQQPDWQSLPINAYPRPKGATPFQTYLTVAYKPCASPNEQHGAPLAVLSCAPPSQASDFLTVGTLDANDQAAKSVGSVRYDVKPGNALTPTDEADVKMNVSIKDVRMKSDLSDYAGELAVTNSRRITDKLNTPAPDGTTHAATTQDTPFSVTVPCAPTTADDSIGSLCALSTTADAIVAGQVKEEMRSNWELGQVQVYDGGADADASTLSDNTLFMDEGIFVP